MIPYVTIKLDKVYNLRFGMAAMLEFERETGVELSSKFNMSLKNVATALWIMLRAENPELTLEKVTKLVDENADNLTYVISKVSEAIGVAFETGESKTKAKK